MVSFSMLRLTLPQARTWRRNYATPHHLRAVTEAPIDAAAIAMSVVELARNGRFAEIEELFAPPLRAVVSAETLRIGWATEIGKNGAVSAIGEPVSEPGQGRVGSGECPGNM